MNNIILNAFPMELSDTQSEALDQKARAAYFLKKIRPDIGSDKIDELANLIFGIGQSSAIGLELVFEQQINIAIIDIIQVLLSVQAIIENGEQKFVLTRRGADGGTELVKNIVADPQGSIKMFDRKRNGEDKLEYEVELRAVVARLDLDFSQSDEAKRGDDSLLEP